MLTAFIQFELDMAWNYTGSETILDKRLVILLLHIGMTSIYKQSLMNDSRVFIPSDNN